MDFDFRRRHDNSTSTFLLGAATGLFLGALAMFVFDPEQGRRRRAIARDKMMRAKNDVGEFVSSTAKDLRNRAQGLAAEARSQAPESARPL